MRTFLAILRDFLPSQTSSRNVRLFRWLVGSSLALFLLYVILFKCCMALEGRSYSWITAVYWAMTNMSTLGLGDVVFNTDLGKLLTIVVNVSGVLFLLILVPLAFYQFFQSSARVPRELPASTRGHVVLTHHDAVTHTLINQLTQHRIPYALVIPDLAEALRLFDQGLKVMLGDLDDAETYRKARVKQASLVATTASDEVNTNVALNARRVSPKVPSIATAESAASVEILKLAGSSHVFQLTEMLGQWLSRKANAGDKITHVIGEYDDLLIAEATATGTPLVGKRIRDCKLREIVGVTVVGVWERGQFELATPDTRIRRNTVLVIAGTQDQLDLYDEMFCIYYVTPAPVVVLGGGRVGQATARALGERQIDYRVVERAPGRGSDEEKTIAGNAADPEVLEKAGIQTSPTVIITTHNDNTNIYLTLYCRHLRPDIQIISRATQERSVQTLHQAGADFVISYASMGATSIFNLLRRIDIQMVEEGLNVFRVKVPASLAGKSIAESSIRPKTGCSIAAIHSKTEMQVNPGPEASLPEGAEIILIGTFEAETRFVEEFGDAGL